MLLLKLIRPFCIFSEPSNPTDGTIHCNASACEMLTRFSEQLCLHYGDICNGNEVTDRIGDNAYSAIELCQHNGNHHGDICDDSESVVTNPEDVFSTVELCQHDEGICEESNVGITGVSPVNEIPSYIHIFASKNKACSQRTQAASVAREEEMANMSKTQHRNHRCKARKKELFMQKKFVPVAVPEHILRNIITDEEIRDQVIVFDGGNKDNPPIECPSDVDHWRSIRITDEKHLHVAMTHDPDKGLIHCAPNGDSNFILLPRRSTLNIIPKKGMMNLFESVLACEKAKGKTLTRGDSKKIFGADTSCPPMYTSIGVQPDRMKRGVTPIQPFMSKLPLNHWNRIMKMMRWSEQAFEMMGSHKALHSLGASKRVNPYETMRPSPTDKKQSLAKYYGAIAFGRNVFLRCHTDQDYTYSIIQVHLEDRDSYSIEEDVIVYFCLTTVGVAVALRPGDFFLFNAKIPHSISSRCKKTQHVLCVSSYLKTAVVGQNDNELDLTKDQKVCLKRYQKNLVACG